MLAAMHAQLANQAAFHTAQTMGGQPQVPFGLASMPPPPRLPPPPAGLLPQLPTGAPRVAPGELLAGLQAFGAAPPAAQPAQSTASRVQKMRQEHAQKEAEAKAAQEKVRCHLHKQPNKKCKFCQRHKEFLDKSNEEKAATKAQHRAMIDARKAQPAAEGAEANEFGAVEFANPKTFGFSAIFHSHVVESTHFKTLLAMEHFEDVVEEVNQFVDTVEPYLLNSGTTASPMSCCVGRFMHMGLQRRQLKSLLENDDNVFIRCAGFLIVRFGLPPEQMWNWVGEYILDTDPLRTSKDAEGATTVGQFVEQLLTQERYFATVLPRLPMTAKRQLEVKLAQVDQLRKRAEANRRHLEVYRQPGVRVEASINDGDWVEAEVVELQDAVPHRPKLRLRLEEGKEISVHLGRAIIADPRFAPNSSRGTDWSYEKGRSAAELIEEMRRREQDKACASGKEYSKRPVSFQIALPMEQGNASHTLIREETD